MSTRYDLAIIGSGPAGLSAALNARIRKKNFIIFGSNNLSNKLAKAPKIHNYLGFPNSTGEEIMNSFKEHLVSMDIQITQERINAVYSMGDYYALMVNEKMYEATSIILATGVEYGKPLKGENEFLGKGVGYCATCDAPLYKGKTVAIISQNEEGEEEANFLSEVCSKVYYIPTYKGEVKVNSSVEVINDAPVEITGEEKASKLIMKNGTLDVDGVFFIKDSLTPDKLVPGLEIEDGHIKTTRLMETNLPGCFAAGDCVGKPYQYIKAAGEGNIAALSATSYIDKKKENK
ncbi:MAG: NAD(P)/FAD-dependent oxidoreductase [Clostridium sp.]